jgi:hypothetical protein
MLFRFLAALLDSVVKDPLPSCGSGDAAWSNDQNLWMVVGG